MNKSLLTSLILSSLIAAPAFAEQQTFTLGYAQGKISSGDKLKGINFKYNYMFDDQFGLIASLSYLKGDKSGMSDHSIWEPDLLAHGKRDTKYISLLAGPSYKVNDMFNLYALAGWSRTKTDLKATWMNYEGPDASGNPTYSNEGQVKGHTTKNAFAYGLGVQITPAPNWAVDVSYEGSKSSNGFKDKNLNIFNIGVGYSF